MPAHDGGSGMDADASACAGRPACGLVGAGFFGSLRSLRMTGRGGCGLVRDDGRGDGCGRLWRLVCFRHGAISVRFAGVRGWG